MSQIRLNFLQWQPDQEELTTDSLSVAQNVLHSDEGYIEARTGTATIAAHYSGTMSWIAVETLETPGSPYLSSSYIDYGTSGSRVEYGLFGSWDNYFETAPALHTAGGSIALSMAPLGNEAVVCGRHYYENAIGNPAQTATASFYMSKASGYYSSGFSTLTSSTTAVSVSGAVCGRVGEFVVLGNLGNNDGGYQDSFSVQWCAIGDATDWPVPATDDARSKQSGKQTLDAKGEYVTAIHGTDFFGYIFQRRALTRMAYVGGDVVWTFDRLESGVGCGYFNRSVQVKDKIFFESEYGRHLLYNDQVTDIGRGRVDKSYPPITTEGVRLFANPSISTVFFSNNLAYNYKTDRWTYLPTIDAAFNTFEPDYIIGQARLATAVTLVTSDSGASLDATLTTAESDPNQGGRSIIQGVRPLHNGGTAAVRVGTRDSQQDSVTWSTSTSVNSRTRMANFRNEGRYHRIELTLTGGFTTAMGADVEYYSGGKV